MAAQRAQFIGFESTRLGELIPLWRASFEEGVGIRDPHALDGQRNYFLNQGLPANDIRLAIEDGVLVGFIAASRTSIAHLYVRIGCQQRRLGTMMLGWAKR
jgi:hypothetical protein